MALEFETFEYSFDPATGVATLTLDRPERLNALTFEVYAELRKAFRQLDSEPGVRSILLTGNGRAFCSGGDVEAIIGQLFKRDYRGLLAFTRATGDLILAMVHCRRPIVGALNGLVAGAGAVIACACDVRIASESARIAFLFTKVGLSGADMGVSWLLPRIVGLGRAMELLMTGDFVSAHEAERIGLYNHVVADGRAAGDGARLGGEAGAGSLVRARGHQAMLLREAAMDLETAMAAETEIQAACMQDPNFREAYDAFLAKRPPATPRRGPTSSATTARRSKRLTASRSRSGRCSPASRRSRCCGRSASGASSRRSTSRWRWPPAWRVARWWRGTRSF
jgi:enoyl-CoA hydratase/carnithine racemase